MINCLVHTVMYTYYMLSAMGDSMKPYLWWKRYLTQFQLVGINKLRYTYLVLPNIQVFAAGISFLYLLHRDDNSMNFHY